LASHPGRIYSRPQILELAYYETDEVSDRIIDSHIKNIRKKVAAVMPDVDLIHSVYGVGYRFEMPT
jgi:two-component system response regulator BaeR